MKPAILRRSGHGGRSMKGPSAASVRAKRMPPTKNGGRNSVAYFAAALLTPQMTMIAAMAAISTGVNGPERVMWRS